MPLHCTSLSARPHCTPARARSPSSFVLPVAWPALCRGAAHELIAAPILIALCVAALLWVLGVAALVGVATLVLSLALTSWLARQQSLLQDLIMHVSDRRVSAISELLTCIKLVKLYSWQFPFSQKIDAVRREQEHSLYRSTAIGAVTRCLGLSSPLFVSFASFAVFSALGHTLDATTAFTALLIFNQLKEPLGKMSERVRTTMPHPLPPALPASPRCLSLPLSRSLTLTRLRCGADRFRASSVAAPLPQYATLEREEQLTVGAGVLQCHSVVGGCGAWPPLLSFC